MTTPLGFCRQVRRSSGWFNFIVPAGERVPTVSIQATR